MFSVAGRSSNVTSYIFPIIKYILQSLGRCWQVFRKCVAVRSVEDKTNRPDVGLGQGFLDVDLAAEVRCRLMNYGVGASE